MNGAGGNSVREVTFTIYTLAEAGHPGISTEYSSIMNEQWMRALGNEELRSMNDGQ
jgi:hypothetical protein